MVTSRPIVDLKFATTNWDLELKKVILTPKLFC